MCDNSSLRQECYEENYCGKKGYGVDVDTVHPEDTKSNFCKLCYKKAFPKPKTKA